MWAGSIGGRVSLGVLCSYLALPWQVVLLITAAVQWDQQVGAGIFICKWELCIVHFLVSSSSHQISLYSIPATILSLINSGRPSAGVTLPMPPETIGSYVLGGTPPSSPTALLMLSTTVMMIASLSWRAIDMAAALLGSCRRRRQCWECQSVGASAALKSAHMVRAGT